jgi:hypothetical protein
MADLIEGIVKDAAEIPVAGAQGYVYVDGILATGTQLANSLGVAVSNPLVTDSFGFYSAYVTFAVKYRIDWYWLGRKRFVDAHTSDAVSGTAFPITPEQFGAIGYKTAALAKAGHDNRTAFQAAIDAVVALGGGEIILTQPHYGFSAQARTSATNDITTGLDGVGLLIDGAHVVFRSTCGVTNVWRRAQAMADPATWANWPLLSTGVALSKFWRGGGIFLKGKAAQPADYATRSGVTLDGVIFQGGILLGASYGNVNNATGDGWDTTDKGIWTDNANVDGSGLSVVGDIRILNGGGIIGFRGELVYGANYQFSTFYVRNGIFGETNGQCINGNSLRVDIDGAYFYNANKGFEGWLGDRGQLLNVTCENIINDSGTGGGKFGAGTFSTFNNPTRFTSTIAPICRVDNLTMKRCGPLYFGAWLDVGKVTLIDSSLYFDNAAYADGLFDTTVQEVVLVSDQTQTASVNFNGGDGATSANQSIRDVRIGKITCVATKVAKAAGRQVNQAVGWYYSLGPRIAIGEVCGEVNNPPAPSAGFSDNAPNFEKLNVKSVVGYAPQNVQTTPALTWAGPYRWVTTTGTGTYPMQLDAPGAEGAERIIRNDGPGGVWIDGNAAGGSGSNLRDNDGPVFLPKSGRTRFRSDGSFWNYVDGGARTFTTTVANLPAAAAVLQGVKAYVTDANATLTAGIGAVVAAGGANKVPVVCDGTNWRIG